MDGKKQTPPGITVASMRPGPGLVSWAYAVEPPTNVAMSIVTEARDIVPPSLQMADTDAVSGTGKDIFTHAAPTLPRSYYLGR